LGAAQRCGERLWQGDGVAQSGAAAGGREVASCAPGYGHLQLGQQRLCRRSPLAPLPGAAGGGLWQRGQRERGRHGLRRSRSVAACFGAAEARAESGDLQCRLPGVQQGKGLAERPMAPPCGAARGRADLPLRGGGVALHPALGASGGFAAPGSSTAVFNPSRAMRGPLQELAKARSWRGMRRHVASERSELHPVIRYNQDERQWQKALHLFRELEDEGLEGTAVTFGSLVSSCEKASQWQRALDLAAQATSRGLGSIVTCNAALSACGKGRNWQMMAMEVFRKVEADGLQGTVVTFGSLVSTCEKSCQWQRALNLMADAAARGLVNIITCNAALSACAKGRNWQKAMEVLDLVQQLRLEPDILTYSAGISACEGFGLWMEALALLGQALANQIQADLIAYNSLLSACAKAGRWQRGFALFDAMESSDAVPPDVISRNAGISSCDQWQRSFCLLTGGDVVSYSAAAFACAKPTEDVTWHQALALLEAAAAAAAAPLGASVVATSAGINACEAAQRWSHALALLQGLHSRRLQPDAIAYSSAASACETAAEWQQALQILRDLKRRLQPDLYCFNAGISACVKAEQWEQALQLLQEAVDTVQVDVITFSSAMSGRWVDWQRAIWLLAEISRREIQANIIAYCSAITSCARGAQWQQALLVLFQSQVSSESIAWDAALTACEKGSWQCTLELLELLKSKRLQMDSISYQAATNSYVRAQKWYPAVPLLEKAGSYAEECCLDALGTVAQKIQRDIQDSSWFAGPGSMR
ncbi:unnamed protein product, partial [Effrenium voratum]